MRCRASGEGIFWQNGIESGGMAKRVGYGGKAIDTPESRRLAAEYTMDRCVDLLDLDPSGVDRLYWLSQGLRVSASGYVVKPAAAASRRRARRLAAPQIGSTEGSGAPQPRRAGREPQAG